MGKRGSWEYIYGLTKLQYETLLVVSEVTKDWEYDPVTQTYAREYTTERGAVFRFRFSEKTESYFTLERMEYRIGYYPSTENLRTNTLVAKANYKLYKLGMMNDK